MKAALNRLVELIDGLVDTAIEDREIPANSKTWNAIKNLEGFADCLACFVDENKPSPVVPQPTSIPDAIAKARGGPCPTPMVRY